MMYDIMLLQFFLKWYKRILLSHHSISIFLILTPQNNHHTLGGRKLEDWNEKKIGRLVTGLVTISNQVKLDIIFTFAEWF